MTTVRIRHRHPEGTDRHGNVFVTPESLEWHEIEYRPVGSCEHQETACRQCLEVWEIDYELDLDDLDDLDDDLAGGAVVDDEDQADAEIVPAGAWGADGLDLSDWDDDWNGSCDDD